MKRFTIEEAEAHIPLIEKMVKKAQSVRDDLDWLMESNEPTLEVNSEDGFHFFVTEQVRVNK